MMKCKDVARLLSSGQEKKFTLREKVGLGVHLAMCSCCREFAHQMHVIRRVCKKMPAADV